MTTKITTLQTLYVHRVSNSVMFPQILYIVLYARRLLPVKFFPEYYFINYVSGFLKRESFLLYFSKQCLVENIKGKFKKITSVTCIPEEFKCF